MFNHYFVISHNYWLRFGGAFALVAMPLHLNTRHRSNWGGRSAAFPSTPSEGAWTLVAESTHEKEGNSPHNIAHFEARFEGPGTNRKTPPYVSFTAFSTPQPDGEARWARRGARRVCAGVKSLSSRSILSGSIGRRPEAPSPLLSLGCGSKLNDRRGKPQVLVHVSTYQGLILVPVF